MKKIKPRVRFCFECGKKLRGNHFVERIHEGHLRIFHKQCWIDLENERYSQMEWVTSGKYLEQEKVKNDK